jgi:hypothetical protein
MTAAKTRSGAAPAKGKSAKSAPARRAATTTPPKASVSKSAPAKAASKRPAAPAAKPVATKPKATPAAATKPALAKTAAAPVAKAAPAKGMPAKAPAKAPAKGAKSVTVKSASPGRKGRGDSGEANLHKRVDSERIAQHIAAFEKSGGRVEKLGVTRVLQKVSEVAATAPAQASNTAGRRP